MLWSALLTSGATLVIERIQRVLHRICYSNVARFISHLLLECRAYEARLTTSAYHSHNIRTTSAWHSRVIAAFDTRFMTRLLRVCPFMYCRCLALLARLKCSRPWVTFGQYCNVASAPRPSERNGARIIDVLPKRIINSPFSLHHPRAFNEILSMAKFQTKRPWFTFFLDNQQVKTRINPN
jgi:hypothetical protein